MSGNGGYAALPVIRRAREYRLYDGSGGRFLDMYQEGGAALLGHRPDGMNRALKSAAAKGLWGALPTREDYRLRSAVERLLGEEELPGLRRHFSGKAGIRLFRNTERFSAAFGMDAPADPLFLSPREAAARLDGPAGALLWRPFMRSYWKDVTDFLAGSGARRAVIVPLLPLPGGFAPCAALALGFEPEELPSGDAVSAAVSCLASNQARLLGRLGGACAGEQPPELFDRPPWRREGPYLLWDRPETEYAGFAAAALERGILLAPEAGVPSIIPPVCTEGEIRPLLSLMEEMYGNL